MRIKELRETAGLTQKAVAEKIGISPQRFCNYENGLRDTPTDLIPPLRRALGCTYCELFGEEVGSDEQNETAPGAGL